MVETVVDARGMACPKPLIITKKMLGELAFGQQGVVLLDNRVSFENVQRFLKDQGLQFQGTEEGDLFKITVVMGENKTSRLTDEQLVSYGSCEPEQRTEEGQKMARAGGVICFKSNLMGSGADDLGAILIQAFVNTLKDAERLPQTVIFYNSGVKLVHRSSPVLPSLQALADMGVLIMVCGTCTNYFEMTADVGVGVISNMYEIINQLQRAPLVLYP